MLFFKEGVVVILYVPYDINETLDDLLRQRIEDMLSKCQLPLPSWSDYNETLEGYVLIDDTDEKELSDVQVEEHIDSYFHIRETHPISRELQKILANEDVMVCAGDVGYCDLSAYA